MDQGTAAAPTEEKIGEPSPSRRHIIERPRLTKLLDESDAKTILLVAPAGYGKTTLARQWAKSSGGRFLWYQANPAAADVAALALELADVLSDQLPKAPQMIRNRLRSASRPDPRVLASALLSTFGDWDESTWLVIDDYQALATSEEAETLISSLVESAPLKLLLTSRSRPRWISARSLLYGEALEINRTALAMTSGEAIAVTGDRHAAHAPGLFALAEGWPAVLGLAALVETLPLEGALLPESLHRYFAEELLAAAADGARPGLCKISLLPHITYSSAASLLGSSAEVTVEEGVRLGFLEEESGTFTLHPILRSFLRAKFLELKDQERTRAVDDTLRVLNRDATWEDCFALAVDFDQLNHLPSIIADAMRSLFERNRIATAEHWVRESRRVALQGPEIDLLEAEVLFRQGNWLASERLAANAALRLDARPPHLRSRALYRAGQSAQFGEKLETALAYHKEAADTAACREDLLQALWGVFVTESELENSRAAREALEAFASHKDGSTENELRLVTGRLFQGICIEGFNRALPSARASIHLLDRPCDPIVASGFRQLYAIALNLTGHYEEALEQATLELQGASEAALAFVVPHAHANQAHAYLGLRLFANAEASISAGEGSALQQDDLHSQLNAVALRSRLRLAQGRHVEAVELTEATWLRAPNPRMHGDLLSTRAMALACAGDTVRAEETVALAAQASKQVETRIQVKATRAILALVHANSATPSVLRDLWEEVAATGSADGLVCAYRGYPGLLPALIESCDCEATMTDIIRRARDKKLAKTAGFPIPSNSKSGLLTAREREVFELLKEGMPNRAIARRLWITLPTVKAHLRHIFAKLQVNGRAEAMLHELEEP